MVRVLACAFLVGWQYPPRCYRYTFRKNGVIRLAIEKRIRLLDWNRDRMNTTHSHSFNNGSTTHIGSRMILIMN